MVHNSLVKSDHIVVLIHPSQLFLEGLSRLLLDTPYKPSLNLASFNHFGSQLCQVHRKLIFLVGGRTSEDILETVRSIREQADSGCIIVIGTTSEPKEVIAAFKAGVHGYLREATTFETLINAIELIVQDEAVVPTEFLKGLRGNLSLENPENEINAAALEGHFSVVRPGRDNPEGSRGR